MTDKYDRLYALNASGSWKKNIQREREKRGVEFVICPNCGDSVPVVCINCRLCGCCVRCTG